MSTVTIERMAAGGDGVGRLPDGMTVFVPRTAPGDTVRVRVRSRHKRYAHAFVDELLSPGPDRITPRCPHYVDDDCGGCQLQHLGLDAQHAAKRRAVGDALRRLARLPADDPPLVPAPAPWRYRSKITLARDGRGSIGLRSYHAPTDVFDLEDCLITRKPVIRLWHAVRTNGALLPTTLDRLSLVLDRLGAYHLHIRSPDRWDPEPLAKRLADHDVSIWWSRPGQPPRVVAGRIGTFPATAFEQSNAELADRIRQDAIAALGPLDGQIVWDLYGGLGDSARGQAAGGARVWSVEADRHASVWARSATPAGADIHYVVGRCEYVVRRLPVPSAVLVNPPRTGLHVAVAAALNRWAEKNHGGTLAYVSCDPATLARDIARMPALQLTAVTAYDLFPQTSHVEVLAVLRPVS